MLRARPEGSGQSTKSLRDSPLKRVQEPLGRRPGGAVTS